jgi:hypothetical protein
MAKCTYSYWFIPLSLIGLQTGCYEFRYDQPVVSCLILPPYIPHTPLVPCRWWDDGWSDLRRARTGIEISIAETFHTNRLSQCFFGNGVEQVFQTICISGSRTNNRGFQLVTLKEHHRTPAYCHPDPTTRVRKSVDWLADYFGLPTDYVSEVRFFPAINTYRCIPYTFIPCIINDLFFLFSFHFPLECATWNLHCTERIRNPGNNAHDAGYVTAHEVPRPQLAPSFRAIVSGKCTPNFTPEGIYMPLTNAKISNNPLHAAGMNCLYATLALYEQPLDWLRCGIAAILSIPTGTRPRSTHLFEPIIGNGHYLQYGGALYGNIALFDNTAKNIWGTLDIDLTITHCNKTRQRRTFDLEEKPNSRYMLVHQPSAPTPIYTLLANVSTLTIYAHINILCELSAAFTYNTAQTAWSFGYRFWARSNDRLTFINPHEFPSGLWSLKGDASVYGFAIPSGDTVSGTAIHIPVSQKKAAIEAGTNIPAHGSTDPTIIAMAKRNPHIDNPVPATTPTGQLLAASPDQLVITNTINKSVPPVFLSYTDLNIKSSCSTGTLHSLFTIITTHLPSHKQTPRDWYLYLKGELILGKTTTAIPPARFTQCVNNAPSQWEISFGLYVQF